MSRNVSVREEGKSAEASAKKSPCAVAARGEPGTRQEGKWQRNQDSRQNSPAHLSNGPARYADPASGFLGRDPGGRDRRGRSGPADDAGGERNRVFLKPSCAGKSGILMRNDFFGGFPFPGVMELRPTGPGDGWWRNGSGRAEGSWGLRR